MKITRSRLRKDMLYKIIFEADTPKGRAFDIALIVLIICSSIAVLAESVDSVRETYGTALVALEMFFAIVFTLEYALRIYCVHNRRGYVTSFFGLIDLMTILPAFVSLVIPSAHFLMVIRVFRLLRLFRIFKMARYVEESGVLLKALKASRPKITVFLFTIFSIVTMAGALMYIVEGPENGYTNIPVAMYWAIVTVSTVGYGDISPQTSLGQLIASALMIMAYGILAVPTGILSYELAQAAKNPVIAQVCPNCAATGHSADAVYCKRCGQKLSE